MPNLTLAIPEDLLNKARKCAALKGNFHGGSEQRTNKSYSTFGVLKVEKFEIRISKFETNPNF